MCVCAHKLSNASTIHSTDVQQQKDQASKTFFVSTERSKFTCTTKGNASAVILPSNKYLNSRVLLQAELNQTPVTATSSAASKFSCAGIKFNAQWRASKTGPVRSWHCIKILTPRHLCENPNCVENPNCKTLEFSSNKARCSFSA